MPDPNQLAQHAASGRHPFALGYDRRPLAEGELPLAHLPASIEAELDQVEQRLAEAMSDRMGVPVTIGDRLPPQEQMHPIPPHYHHGEDVPPGEAVVKHPPELCTAQIRAEVCAEVCVESCAGQCEPGEGLHTSVGRGEPLFTLAEARAEMVERECASEGHDLEIISAYNATGPTPTPVAIVCQRGCQLRGYRVVPIGALDVSELLTAALVDLWADLGAAYDRSAAVLPEDSIECNGLIARIVDITRTLGVIPAEIVPPQLVAIGLYVEVHRLAGHVATVAPCTMASAEDAVRRIELARGAMAANA